MSCVKIVARCTIGVRTVFNEFPKNALQNYMNLGHAFFTNEKPSKSQINADLKKQQFMP